MYLVKRPDNIRGHGGRDFRLHKNEQDLLAAALEQPVRDADVVADQMLNQIVGSDQSFLVEFDHRHQPFCNPADEPLL